MRFFRLPSSRAASTSAVFALCLSAPASAPAAIVASSAADVCAPADDPCFITEEVDIAPGSTLDFGLRTLRIEGDGVLDFGESPAAVRAGRIEVDVEEGAVAIRAHARVRTGAQQPLQRLEAVRQCSNSPRDCFSESDCDLGTCGVRRCALEPDALCVNDAGCSMGECSQDGRCQFQYDRFCTTNADCHTGPCGTQLTCSNWDDFLGLSSAEDPVDCTSNSDCSLGDCSVGDGQIELGGAADVAVADPHGLQIRAASDLEVAGPIDVTNLDGEVLLVSGLESVALDAPIRSHGEKGVILFVSAAGDILVRKPIDADGDERPGQIGLNAGNDLLIEADLSTSVRAGRESAGEVYLRADRDIRTSGGSTGDLLEIRAGFLEAASPDGRDGDGGWVDFDADRDIVIDEHTRVLVDGEQSTLSAWSGRNFELAGRLTSIATGADLYESDVRIYSGHDIIVAADATIEIVGNGGALPGQLLLEAERDVDLSGTLQLLQPVPHAFAVGTNLSIRGCMIRLRDGAEILNEVKQADTILRARGGVEVDGGASILNEEGSNEVMVRHADDPLRLDGNFDPPPDVAVNPGLDSCPNCIDPDSGDREFCDDGLSCTADSCIDGACSVAPSDVSCEDNVFCNGASTCSLEAGCVQGPPVDCSHLDEGCVVGECDEATDSCIVVDADIACDDGDECTDGDSCRAGVCKGKREIACGDCGSDTIEWGEECDDGNTAFAFGEACRADCQWTGCGHPTGSTGTKPGAADALYVLRTAVELDECDLFVCDANDSGAIETADALLVLRAAVGLPAISCPQPEI